MNCPKQNNFESRALILLVFIMLHPSPFLLSLIIIIMLNDEWRKRYKQKSKQLL